ncbi:VOC family protein [Ornithinimicrobium ciconiae]|uniref:VOC family protein n=1 Tax=Ornithinimicrobium ciconiae TaxID=2594265 RepID=A0A516GDY0_9MICO|nr:VOC family protein [Ornithinimicrobium ciconiae]QDO89705.1 VOC family protein [Ornithinimicrobium ciconiae]
MDQRLSLVTLGVRDLDRATTFYTALGWERAPSPEGVVFFQTGGIVVALWDRAALEVDSCAEDSGGWGGVTLAYNVNSREEVDDALDEAEAAGATIGRRGGGTFWGGYSGVFTDPEGHPWEVSHNPFWSVTEDGRTLLGDGRG